MAASEFEIDGRLYRVRDFESDVHISLLLRLAPVFQCLAVAGPDMLGARQRQAAAETRDGLVFLSELLRPNTPTAEALASLDRTGDAKLIIAECLKVADQRAEDRWVPVMTKLGVILNQVDNGTWIAKLKITLQAVRINFGRHLADLGVDVDAFVGGAPDAGV